MNEDQYLIHYGIKGMRWGHRKSPELSTKKKEKSPSLAKALGMMVGLTAITSAAVMGATFLAAKGSMAAKSAVLKGIDRGKRAFDSLYNADVLDANGNVLKRYKLNIREIMAGVPRI